MKILFFKDFIKGSFFYLCNSDFVILIDILRIPLYHSKKAKDNYQSLGQVLIKKSNFIRKLGKFLKKNLNLGEGGS